MRSDDAALLRYLEELFDPLAVGGTPASEYEITAAGDRYTLTYETEHIVETDDPAHALGMLLWHVNQKAVARSSHLVRLHAAVASCDAAAVLLPAPMEAGKTTLVAGLVRAGMDYLSDEVAALDPDTLDVLAYPKALSVDEGSWEVLADLAPNVEPNVAAYQPRQWQVPASSVRAGALAATARPRFVVFPRFEPGTSSRLTPLGRAEAAGLLTHCTFQFDRQPARDLVVLARLVRQTDAYQLRVGRLDDACRLVLALYDTGTSSEATDA